MRSLLIIDGSSLLSTSYYGNLPFSLMTAKTPEARKEAYKDILQTSKGVYTNGIYGFVRALKKILKEQKPTHLAVVFDVSRKTTFRRELTETYKATRKETPDPLKQQFALTQEILEYINVPVFKGPLYEADDYAGSLVRKFEERIPVYCHTKDEDYLQLLSEYTRIWLVTSKADEMLEERGINRKQFNIPDKVFEYTKENIKEIKGLDPLQIVDYKAICGDASDNIQGVKGCGEKAVIPLLQKYGTVEGIYDVIEGLDAKEEKELKKFFKESLGIARSPIATLLGEGAIVLENAEKISYRCCDEPNTEEGKELQNLFREKIGNLLLPIEITTAGGLELLRQYDVMGVEPSAKEYAFLGKKLATIKTDIEEIQEVQLDDLKLNIDEGKLREKLLEYEMKSLL